MPGAQAMDPLRVLLGIGVAVFMAVAPQLGLPYLEALPVDGARDAGGTDAPGTRGPGDGPQEIARVGLEVGERVALKTLDAGGNRSALRVLWAEVEGGKLDHQAQGQGRVAKLRFLLAAPASLALGAEALRLRPGDEVAVEGFQGKWAYAPEGMVGLLRLEGSVLAARVGERGLRPVGTDEEAPPWATGSGPSLAGNVTVRAGRTTFVSTEASAGDEVVRHVRARDVRINGARVEGTRWGEGALDSLAFTAAGPGFLKGEGSARALTEGQRVEVTDFIGAYVVFYASGGEARVALEGYASRVVVREAAEARAPEGANRAPLPAFDWSPAEPYAGEAVKFWDRSLDTDGLVVRREWRFGDGAASQERSPSHAYAEPGVYVVTLVVTDNSLVTASLDQPITVRNNPPRAGFEVSPESPTTLDAVRFLDASSDLDGRIAAREWDFGDGARSTDANPVHTFADDGRFTVRLAVWDDAGERAAAERVVEVRNVLPQARFSWLPAEPLSGQAVEFRDASSDADGRIVAWAWTFGDGATSTEPAPSHVFAGKGLHRVRLTVHDDDGGSASFESPVEVRNQAPQAAFRVVPDPPAEGAPARFVDMSQDPDGRVVERFWSFGDGSVSAQPEPEHTFLQGGAHTVTLTVRDDDGARATAMRTLTVNRRPLASFVATPAQPVAGMAVRFHDTSLDPDGRVAAWRWDFGDGNTSAAQSPEHRFARSGAYAVALEAMDDQGATGRVERVLNVTNALPRADFAWEPAQPSTAEPVTFRDASRDADGSLVRWTWTFSDGSAAEGPVATKRFEEGGAQAVTLVVVDDEGATASVTKLLEVNAAPLADFGFLPAAPSTASDVQFRDASRDLDGRVAAWRWDFGDGTASTLPEPIHRFGRAGVFTVRLTVTDDRGATGSAAKPVAVGALPPVAAFRVAPEVPRAGEAVRFTDLSSDPDGSVVAWRWDFGDGTQGTGPAPEHAYAASGTYRVRLTVTDDAGRVATAERALRVAGAEPLVATLRLLYPDGQPVDLARPGVEVELRDAASSVRLAKGGARPLEAGSDGLLRGALEAGEWAAGDEVVATVRVPSAQVEHATRLALPASGDLGSAVFRVPLTGRVSLAPPSRAPGSAGGPFYSDPTERVQGSVLVHWKDGAPVRGAKVRLGYAWDPLGSPSAPVRLDESFGETGSDGALAFAVPYTLGFPSGPGAYLPGTYRVFVEAEHVVADGLAQWKGQQVFVQDPGGARSFLRR